ncbi:hypothetical protein Scep_014175 [Stephania cephalantha]|uniref:Uncharacterized protein n=1 Tax=Stephania cephalantha TaxID=152367 RepID=A0AAP0J0S2_9MAGN
MAPFGTRRKRRACTQSTRRRHYRRQLFKSTSMKQVLESPTSLTTTLTSIISSAITTNVISSGGSSSSSSGSDHRALKIDYDQCLIMRVDNEDIKMNNNTITISDFLTPKAERFRIPDIETCPPAPKKRRVLVSSPYCTLSSSTSSKRSFFTSPDIELFFYFAMNNISA